MVARVNKKRKRAKKADDDDYIDRLLKENRELKSINRTLLKQLKKLSKGINKDAYEEALDEVVHEPKKENPKQACEQCGKGRLNEIDIAGRKFLRCNNEMCGWKSKRIK